MKMATDIFTTRSPDEVDAALRRAGFTNVRFDRPDRRHHGM
jgi:hypothetical protein